MRYSLKLQFNFHPKTPVLGGNHKLLVYSPMNVLNNQYNEFIT